MVEPTLYMRDSNFTSEKEKIYKKEKKKLVRKQKMNVLTTMSTD